MEGMDLAVRIFGTQILVLVCTIGVGGFTTGRKRVNDILSGLAVAQLLGVVAHGIYLIWTIV